MQALMFTVARLADTGKVGHEAIMLVLEVVVTGLRNKP